MKIIVSSQSKECIGYLFHTYDGALSAYKHLISIETGHTNRIVINEDTWNNLPENVRFVIQHETHAFVSGWEAKENY